MKNKEFDFEHLLLSKEFNQLNTDELSNAMQFISSEEEYTDMRHLLLTVRASHESDEIIYPKAELKETLLKSFGRKNNSDNITWIGIAASIIILLGLVFLFQNKDEDKISEMKNVNERSLPSNDSLKRIAENQIAENKILKEEILKTENTSENKKEEKAVKNSDVPSISETFKKYDPEADNIVSVSSIALDQDTILFTLMYTAL